MAKTIRELVMEYFKNHPNEELPHGPVVDWVGTISGGTWQSSERSVANH